MYIVSGEVQAKVWYTENKKIYFKQEILRETGAEEKKHVIKFNNFQINFNKTLSKFKICDTIYTEQNLRVFSNFYLPISILTITNKEQEKILREYSKEEAIDLGKESLSEIIEKQIEDKNKICGTTMDVKETEEYVDVYLTYEVLENIETYEKIEY